MGEFTQNVQGLLVAKPLMGSDKNGTIKMGQASLSPCSCRGYWMPHAGSMHKSLVLVHGQVTIIFVVSVCLSVCLFVCLCRVFSAVFDPIWIKLGHMLHVRV